MDPLIIAIGAIILGGIVGYYLRYFYALSQRKGIELEVKQLMLGAKEDAQRILDDAKKKAEEKSVEFRNEERKKEANLKEKEERLIKKEGLLDGRQADIDKEAENLKLKIEDVKKIR